MTNEDESEYIYGYAMFLKAKLEPKISGKIIKNEQEEEEENE